MESGPTPNAVESPHSGVSGERVRSMSLVSQGAHWQRAIRTGEAIIMHNLARGGADTRRNHVEQRASRNQISRRAVEWTSRATRWWPKQGKERTAVPCSWPQARIASRRRFVQCRGDAPLHQPSLEQNQPRPLEGPWGWGSWWVPATTGFSGPGLQEGCPSSCCCRCCVLEGVNVC